MGLIMKYKTLVFAVIACSLLLVGCQQQQEDQQQDITEPFIGGNIGLNTHLLEGVPPKVIQDNGQSVFSYAIVMENQGEADVGPGTENNFVQVKLEGVNPGQWGVNESVKQLQQPLRGARKNIDGTMLPGEMTTVSFEGLSYQKNIRGNTEFVLRGDVCYDYTTYTSTQICLKDNVLENIQDSSVCTLTGEKNPKNSGAPLHITSLIQNPLAENKIQIAFEVEHVGQGQFYGDPQFSNAEEESCNPSPSNFNKNKVTVVVKPISDPGYKVDCPRFGGGNQGTIKLAQGAPQRISCTVERTRSSEGRIFQDIMEINLHYRYQQFIETPIVVQDVSNEPGAETGASGTGSN